MFFLLVSVESGHKSKRYNQLTNRKPNICKNPRYTRGKKSHRFHVSGLDIIRKNVIFHLNFLVFLFFCISSSASFFEWVFLSVRTNFRLFVCSCVCVCACVRNAFLTSGNSWNLIRNKTQNECIKTSRCFHEICSCCRFYVRFDFTQIYVYKCVWLDRFILPWLCSNRQIGLSLCCCYFTVDAIHSARMFDEQVFPRSAKKPNDKIHLLKCLAKHFMWNCGWNKILSNGFDSHAVNTH